MIKKEGWEIKKLGEECDLYQPKTISQQEMIEDGKYDVYGANGIIGKYDKYNHENSELLMTCRGATCGAMNISRPFSWINGNAMVIHPKQLDKLEFNFLHYQLKAFDLKDAITGAAQPQITRQTLTGLQIIIPPLPIQQQIVSELDTLSEIIAKKKQQLAELDNLAQATFYDMFGDPVRNEKGWEMSRLDDLGEWSSGGTPSRNVKSYYKGGINWYSAGELNSLFLPPSKEKITEQALIDSSAKLFKSNSLFIGMYDTAAFKMGIIKSKASSNQACANIFPNSNVSIIFLYFILQEMKEHFLKMRRGIRQQNLNLGMIKKFVIPLPELCLQTQFAEKINALEKQKELIKKTIADTQLLFDFTMDKYFND